MSSKEPFIPLWHRREPEKKEMPSKAAALYKSAKVNDCWIYDLIKKKFYTPEEFAEKWESVYREPGEIRPNLEFKVMSPMAAIKQRAEWVRKASEELQAVLEKLEKYNVSFERKKE
ncbi:hypothetical protein [Sphingobacterium corticibacter]|uniref:Uncharacterized protein n=1 Tax=Sphingobacterium corticibacter TaxID=2171749 RepID=A0A2T8HNL8_9SPHI|nr:hypothetical protein [Sphingobacterium corticibacter]PVH27021.1 hypothetical protein DC487_05340 [Sphingobacterium corticibacter]